MRKIEEDEVVRRTQAHLADHDDYTRLASPPARGRGPDLKVKHRRTGHYFIIEAKGEGHGTATDAKKESMLNAMGQLLTRFAGHNGRRYGLAFPSLWKPRVFGKLTPAAVSAHRLHLFFVDRLGRVEHLPPRAVKRLVRESHRRD